MQKELVKFSSQADPIVISELKKISNSEGKLLQYIIEEAFKDYIEKKKSKNPKVEIMKAFNESLKEFDELYEKLAINHPFLDGNKIIAFAATDIFLKINGYKIKQSAENMYY